MKINGEMSHTGEICIVFHVQVVYKKKTKCVKVLLGFGVFHFNDEMK